VLSITKTLARQSRALTYQPICSGKLATHFKAFQGPCQAIMKRAFSVLEKPTEHINKRSESSRKYVDIECMNPSILTLEQLVEILVIYKQAIKSEKTLAAQEILRNKIVEYEFYIDMRKDKGIPF